MKKIRVKYLAGITALFLALSFISKIIFTSFSSKIKLPWELTALMLFFIIISLATVLGLVSNYDFEKKFGGELIDENQYIRWSNLFETRWMVFFFTQLIFIFLNPLLMNYIAIPIVEGWSLGKEYNPSSQFRFLLTFSPTLIFIFGGIIWKINKSDEELIKLKRRDRIKTEDLESLDEKVDLKKWLSDDILLRTDKELILKLVSIDEQFIFKTDDNLLDDKKFVLDLIKSNEYAIIYISEDYKKDIEVILEYIKKFPENVVLIEMINKSLIDHPSISPFIINQTEEEKKLALVKFLAIMKMKEMLGK